MNQTFAIKMMVEDYLGKSEKFYVAFMDQQKAYDELIEKLYGTFYKIYDGIEF